MTDSADELWASAQQHLAAKQAGPARAALQALLAEDPSHVLAQLALCDLAWREDRVREVAQRARDAAAVVPPFPELICDVIAKLLLAGETVAARDLLLHSALVTIASDVLLMRLADHWHYLGQEERALALLDRARELGLDGDQIRFRRGQQLLLMGRESEAEPELELSLALTPVHGRSALALSGLRRQTRERNHFNRLATGLKNVARGTRDHAALEFALYKELEDVGRYDDAWQALLRGNAAMAARKRHDAERQRQFIDRFIACATPQSLHSAEATQEGPQPIFIIGMPRCGAGLLERLLGHHSRVQACGELGEFGRQLHWVADHRTTQDETFLARLPQIDHAEVGRRYLAQAQWRARDKPFFVDKQPPNWMVAGLIHAALPRSPILHVTRDAMDMCFSNYRTFFGDAYAYSYDLAAIAAQHRDYRKLMAHWRALIRDRLLDVSYERLLRDPEATMRKVLAFCGLAWEPECANAGRCEQAKATAAWQPYAAQLAGLRNALQPG